MKAKELLTTVLFNCMWDVLVLVLILSGLNECIHCCAWGYLNSCTTDTISLFTAGLHKIISIFGGRWYLYHIKGMTQF